MKRTLLASAILACSITALFATWSWAQLSPPPTSTQQWQQVLANLNENNPTNLVESMAAMYLKGYRGAYPNLPTSIQQTLLAGDDLSTDQINTIGQAVFSAVGSDETTALSYTPVAPDSRDEQVAQALYKAMTPIVARTAAPDTDIATGLDTAPDSGLADIPGALVPDQPDGLDPEPKAIPSFTAPDTSAADIATPRPGTAIIPTEGVETPALPTAQMEKAVALWEDYIHYLRIARLDLAISSGQALLDMNLQPQQWLSIIEEGPYEDYDQTLVTAQRMQDSVAEQAKQIAEAIKDSYLAVARESQRIRAAIGMLDDGLRARLHAHNRLKRAGQYAAPLLLETLQSVEPSDEQLHPYIIEAMVVIGRPMVDPLAVALDQLRPLVKQQVAEVLARIGYPMALPYIKAEVDNPANDASTREVLQIAFDRIVERTGVPRHSTPDQLFLMLAEDYYHRRESLILEPTEPYNLLWLYDRQTGLMFQKIPTPIYHDVNSLRASRRALRQNPNLSAALSLWLAANFRRENNLPAGEDDPSYGLAMQSPHFYATIAGPRHVHTVLQRSLNDLDADLALDAIAALATTASTKSLINVDGVIKPLVAAMNYPDRRVRFESALAIGRSRPRIEFPGAQRVVPVLAEAVREEARRVAVVLGSDLKQVQQMSAVVRDAGTYHIIMGNSIPVASEQLHMVAVVDVVLVQLPMTEAEQTLRAVREHAKMAHTPVLMLVEGKTLPTLKRLFKDVPGLFFARIDAEPAELTEAVKQAAGSTVGPPLDAEQAESYANRSLQLLHGLTVEHAKPFHTLDAQPALLGALDDPRSSVVLNAARVLARYDTAVAQRAIADAALDAERDIDVRVQLFQTLATSARMNGNQMTGDQLADLLKVVDRSRGALADAAADAHGALNLPTSNAVDLIIGKQAE